MTSTAVGTTGTLGAVGGAGGSVALGTPSTSGATTGAVSTTAGGAGAELSGSGGAGGQANATTGMVGSGVTTGGMAGIGGMGGTTGVVMSDDFTSDVTISVHDEVNTILVVEWTQVQDAEETWLEFSFEEGNVMTSRPKPGTAGAHRDVVLGVPGDTEVTVSIMSSQGGQEYRSSEYTGTTDPVPAGMPLPTVLSYDETLASPDRWMLGAVEDSDGGCADSSCYYHTTFWLYIIDRQGRVVWYYADPATNATSSFQRIARDGEYIWIEKRPFSGGGSRSVLKTTLDWEYHEEVPVAGLSDCIDVTDDGSLLYDTVQEYELREMSASGDVRTIWSCPDRFGQGFTCYSNTVNYNPLGDTVVLSFPYENTVIEIDRQSGDVVGQYGDANGSYAFSPSSWQFEFQHFANITRDGTLLVSSHMPGYDDTFSPVAGQHAFMEFDIDRENEVLIERWVYNEGDEWAMFKGMAMRLENGNTLANYGTGGVIREITPDKETAFHVKFDVEGGDDFFNKMVGNNVLLDDLYALNGGGPQ